ncbi:MAG: molybdate ABC transporter permease subunit [Clostridiales bacterium]|jgi:molybdate transport system permease protein|nr:molybdate ABC transporter permease subunit [Clostridiales bacterium]
MSWEPLFISIKTAVASIVVTFIFGTAAAWGVALIRSQKLRSVLDGLLTLPLVLPPTVAGFMLLYVFGVKRPIGHFLVEFLGIKVVFNWSATVIAAVAISFPLMYRSARGAFEQVEQNLLSAARTLGMSEWKVLRKVWLPLAAPGVISGGMLAFARGLGEFGATAMIAGNIAGKTRTLPLAIYSEVAGGNMENAYEYVAILAVVSFLVVTGMNWVVARRRKWSK